MSAGARARVGLLRLPLSADASDGARMRCAARECEEKLYVLLEGDWGALSRSEAQHRLLFVYDELGKAAPTLDARVLLPGPKAWIVPHATEIEAFLAAQEEEPALALIEQARTDNGLPALPVRNIAAPCPAALQGLGWDATTCERLPAGSFAHVVLGGTFDRIHAGHKLLLAMSALCAKTRLLVGISCGPLLDSKTLKELIHPIELRSRRVFQILYSMRPCVAYQIVPIEDPFGPSITDAKLECIVVSKETERGGQSVNKRRVERGLGEVHIDVVDLVGPEDATEEDKVSSTGLRQLVLGSFCGAGVPPHCLSGGKQGMRDWLRRTNADERPYCVGITGGIAAGKSSIVNHLRHRFQVAVVDCDKLGHAAYVKGTAAFDEVVAAFGADIVDAGTGEVDRKKLGALAFSDAAHMQTLNGIVWPAIRALALAAMQELKEMGAEVCVMEAAVLLEAGWHDLVDEVWVVVVPEAEAKRRLMARNALSEEDAQKRIRAQMTNPERISKAHVILSNHGELDSTHAQVEAAWGGVAQRKECVLPRADPPSKRALHPPALDTLVHRWSDLCEALGVVSPSLCCEWWHTLRQLYTGSGRFYHTLQHIHELFTKLDAYCHLCASVPLVSAAIFFHDAIYDAKRQDNEELSAQLWEKFGAVTALPPDDIATVAEYIRRTAKHHGQGRAEGDLAVFLDLDLSILGAKPCIYARYAQDIALEYCHINNMAQFCSRRAAVLKTMAVQPSVYFTPEIKAEFESQARENLAHECSLLAAYADILLPHSE